MVLTLFFHKTSELLHLGSTKKNPTGKVILHKSSVRSTTYQKRVFKFTAVNSGYSNFMPCTV